MKTEPLSVPSAIFWAAAYLGVMLVYTGLDVAVWRKWFAGCSEWIGLAAAAVKKLEAADPAVRQRLEYKAQKTLRRRRETRQRAKAVQAGQRKPWASPPQEKKPL